jgi:hypothetical protein
MDGWTDGRMDGWIGRRVDGDGRLGNDATHFVTTELGSNGDSFTKSDTSGT